MCLPSELISALFFVLHGNNSQFNQVAFADYILHSSQLLQGSVAKKVWLLWKLFSYGHDSGKTTNFELSKFRSMVESFLRMILTSPLALSVLPHNNFTYDQEGCNRLVNFILALLSSQSSSSPSESGQASAEDLEHVLTSSPLLMRMFEVGFAFCFYREALKNTLPDISASIRYQMGLDDDSTSLGGIVHDKLFLPVLTQNPQMKESFGSTILDKCGLILLNSFFPADVRGQLFPLFSSTYQGESFSTFCKQLLGCQGPSLIVVKDKGGHVFGGFAAEGWSLNPQFTGLLTAYMYICIYMH